MIISKEKNTVGYDPRSHTELSLVVPKDQIHILSWTFDALDGTAILRTDDAFVGAVTLMFPTCRLGEVEEVLGALERGGIAIQKTDRRMCLP